MVSDDRTVCDVLIADDDVQLRELLAQVLRHSGYTVGIAAGADDVLDYCDGPGFTVLVADINMPGNANLELLTALAARQMQSPVILMTGQPTVDTAVRSISLNVYHYLVKPFEMETFVQLIQDACRLGRLRDSVSAAREDFLNMADQLNIIQEQLTSSTRPDVDAGTVDYLAVVMNSVLRALKGGSQSLGGAGGITQHSPAAMTDDLRMLTSALKETVSVLEKTKSSFKSKELGVLRKKLNMALEMIEES